MKKRGFTLIELLVVVAIIAMLLAILMPALNKVKKIAQRVVCGTNLKGLGNAQVVYANDYNGQYACQGHGADHTWAVGTTGWQIASTDFGVQGKELTVGASLYLLVRQADVSPKSFVCPASDQQAFSGKNRDNLDIVELWDFGQRNANTADNVDAEGAARCVSYAYQQPYSPDNTSATGRAGRYRADDQRSAAFAMMADRSPWYDDKLEFEQQNWTAQNFMERVASIGRYWEGNYTPPANKTERQCIMVGNAQPHEREGQNVLFADGHSDFEKTSDCGVKNDNIYCRIRPNGSTAIEYRVGDNNQGAPDRSGVDETPYSLDDSYLVNDFL